MQDHLKVDIKLLNPATLQQIVRKFPNITSFEFLQKYHFLPQLCKLLNAWREHLSELKVVFFPRKPNPILDASSEEAWSKLIDSLKGWYKDRQECRLAVVGFSGDKRLRPENA